MFSVVYFFMYQNFCHISPPISWNFQTKDTPITHNIRDLYSPGKYWKNRSRDLAYKKTIVISNFLVKPPSIAKNFSCALNFTNVSSRWIIENRLLVSWISELYNSAHISTARATSAVLNCNVSKATLLRNHVSTATCKNRTFLQLRPSTVDATVFKKSHEVYLYRIHSASILLNNADMSATLI